MRSDTYVAALKPRARALSSMMHIRQWDGVRDGRQTDERQSVNTKCSA